MASALGHAQDLRDLHMAVTSLGGIAEAHGSRRFHLAQRRRLGALDRLGRRRHRRRGLRSRACLLQVGLRVSEALLEL
jgi:hypothetical protein